LINEIVLAEETDINLFGERQSHFEMYLDAMEKANASTKQVQQLIAELKKGATVQEVMQSLRLPQSVQQFLRFTFNVICSNKPHEIAAAFTYGREELIPDMFTSIIGEIQQKFPEEDLSLFKYYFDRHIELDGDEHGPMALELITELCGNDDRKWEEVKQVSIEALNVRAKLWDGIENEITQSLELAQ
jgi:pyrroloquinoline quinone (PQQ) biosynthesis protein C